MKDSEYIELERKYNAGSGFWQLIRNERDRRRHVFMSSVPKSRKELWKWHLELCEEFNSPTFN